jgi:hypothetical protein
LTEAKKRPVAGSRRRSRRKGRGPAHDLRQNLDQLARAEISGPQDLLTIGMQEVEGGQTIVPAGMKEPVQVRPAIHIDLDQDPARGEGSGDGGVAERLDPEDVAGMAPGGSNLDQEEVAGAPRARKCLLPGEPHECRRSGRRPRRVDEHREKKEDAGHRPTDSPGVRKYGCTRTPP